MRNLPPTAQRSLLLLFGLGVLGAGLYLYQSRKPAAKPETKAALAPPQAEGAAVEAPTLPFTDVTKEWGIGFVHENGAYGEKLLPESMGSGVAAFDFDNDGDTDLLFVNADSWPWRPRTQPRPSFGLYRNDGQGHFQNATSGAGLSLSFYGMGVACGDFDGDGWIDLLLTGVGGNRLLKNQEGKFTDVTRKAGVGGLPDDWTTAAAFFDADGDGDLDLYIGHYVRWSKEIDLKVDYKLPGVGRAYGPPNNYEGTVSRLYRNEGNGTFTDVTEKSGIAVKDTAGGPAGKALGVAPVDADGDGRMDLFVANDTAANFFFHNKSTRAAIAFEEIGAGAGVALDAMGNATGAMGIDTGHLRNDGELGIAIGNFANEMTSLYLSQGDRTLYADEATAAGIGAPSRLPLKFGVLLVDVDLDGRLDLVQTNGHLDENIPKADPGQSYRQSAQVFWNAGAKARQEFFEVPSASLKDLAKPIVGRGSAAADLDGDGDLDLVMTQVKGSPLVLRNDQALGHHWIRLQLAGTPPNREAIGAWIEVTAGGQTQRRQVMPTRSYLSQSELPVTIGLGAATKVDFLKVRWPSGKEESFAGVALDQITVLEEGKGRG